MTPPAHPDRRPAFVTGASSGIGAATALMLADQGHPVALAARRMDRLTDLRDTIRSKGGEAVAVELHLTDPEAIAAAADEAVAELGEIEVFVSVAGEVLPMRAHEVDPQEFLRQIQINLLGVQALVAAFVPGMIDRRRGDVVLVSSDVTRLPRPTMASYVTAKWGLEGLARGMQLELEGTGVRSSLVRPGPTLTEMGSEFPAERLSDLMAEWTKHGFMRHEGFLDAEGPASAVMAIVSAPRGTHLTIIEVQPEAPVKES